MIISRWLYALFGWLHGTRSIRGTVPDKPSFSKMPDSQKQTPDKSESIRNRSDEVAGNCAIDRPKHYELLNGVESITVIASSLSVEGWHGYCLGNILKYRHRAGNKDDIKQDIGKADQYKNLYDKHKHLCKCTKAQ